jgi:hypothetical protein
MARLLTALAVTVGTTLVGWYLAAEFLNTLSGHLARIP